MNEPESWDYPIDEKIDDSFAPFTPLTHVQTIGADIEAVKEIVYEEWCALRKWGESGMIVDAVQENPKWFEVLHNDGSIGYYYYTEIEIRDDADGDDDGDDDDSPSGPDNGPPLGAYIVPQLEKCLVKASQAKQIGTKAQTKSGAIFYSNISCNNK